MSGIEYRSYRSGDEQQILETFNLTFAEVCGEDFEPRSLARWYWQYRDNPAGRRIMLGIAPDGRVACQYAGVPIRIWCSRGGGTELSFFHAVDSMVHPEFRTGLRRRGPFLEVAERFFDTYGGKVDALGFGYPVRDAWRIGERFLGYRLIHPLEFLLRAVGGTGAASEVEVQRIERFPVEVDALFRELREHFDCTTVKDAAYLNWRYAGCPDQDYRMLWAERRGEASGFAVLRAKGNLVPDAACLGELLVDPRDHATLAALVGEADRIAAEAGQDRLMTVQNPGLPCFATLESLGFERRPSSTWLERKLGSRDFTSGLDQDWLDRHWAYALGDSDLF